MALNKLSKKHAMSVASGDIVTPRLIAHMSKDHDVFVEQQHLARMVELLSKPQPRLPGWHPSAISGCERAQVFEFLGVPGKRRIPLGLACIFLDGHWRGMKWQAVMLAAGILDAVEVRVKHKTGLVGVMDGVGTWQGAPFVYEGKGTAAFATVKQYGALPPHKKQIHSYFIAHNTDTGVIFYEDKTTNDFLEVVVREDPAITRGILRTLDGLNESVANQDLPQVLDECEYGEGAYTSCSFAYLCKQVGWAEAEAAAAVRGGPEAVVVQLGLKPRNTHRKPPANGASGRGNPVVAKFASGAGSVPPSPTRKIRVTRR